MRAGSNPLDCTSAAILEDGIMAASSRGDEIECRGIPFRGSCAGMEPYGRNLNPQRIEQSEPDELLKSLGSPLHKKMVEFEVLI